MEGGVDASGSNENKILSYMLFFFFFLNIVT